jgi:hypothetical protein
MITTKVDNRKRVLVPHAKPGQGFAVESRADGSFTLNAVQTSKAPAAKRRVTKGDGFTLVVPGQPINEQAVKELLADFP